jgi:hypothetical protein
MITVTPRSPAQGRSRPTSAGMSISRELSARPALASQMAITSRSPGV